MKNIEKSKNEEMNKKREKKKKEKTRKKTKNGRKKKKVGKKRKEGPKGHHPRWAPKLIFHIRTVKRNRNEIDAEKKSDFEHPTKTENERK